MTVTEAPPRTEPAPPSRSRPQVSPGALWWAGATLAVVVALILSMVAVGIAAGRSDSGRAGVSAKTQSGPPQTFTIALGDLFVRPNHIDATAGRPVVLKVTNGGQMVHDLQLEGGSRGTGKLAPGQSKQVRLGALTGDAQAWCTVPGHKAAGMVLDINVKGTSGAAASAATSHASATPDATIDFDAMPAAGWKPFDPTLAPAAGGTTHAVTFHATETVREVAPGVKQQMWTFNGQVPGPTLRGHVGDVFTVTLVNDGKLGHSIDFHASKTAMNVNMRTLQPGESLVYQYRADYAGIWMYHCGTAPTLHHIGNGMFGAVIVDPPGLAPVDHEYVLVQSELYLGPQGQPGDLDKMQREAFDAVTFNGYVNQYKDAPIQVGLHQRERVWVLDAGPSENSSFHIVGTIFDTVFKEGEYLLRPGAGRGGSQTLDLQPAQGGFVEFTLDEPGNYAMVTHKFANVGKGAIGLFQVPGAAASEGGH
jgi:nitrite reductase (NO-forming)